MTALKFLCGGLQLSEGREKEKHTSWVGQSLEIERHDHLPPLPIRPLLPISSFFAYLPSLCSSPSIASTSTLLVSLPLILFPLCSATRL